MHALEYVQNSVCDACQKDKIKRSSHKSKTESSITISLQFIHIDLFSLENIMWSGKKRYVLVMVDDFSRYIWIEFMHSKDETP